MDIRVNGDGQVQPSPRGNATPAYGVLLIAGATPFVTASNPAAEVLDSAGAGSGGVTAGSAFGVTQTIASGLLTIVRPGVYDVELDLEDVSCGAGSGNVAFSVLKNGAAFSGSDVMTVTKAAATAKAGMRIKRRVALTKGDTVSATVTSAAGNAITITGGTLSVTQVADSITDKTA